MCTTAPFPHQPPHRNYLHRQDYSSTISPRDNLSSIQSFRSFKFRARMVIRNFKNSRRHLEAYTPRVFKLRIRLSSTLRRRKRSPKTEPFENALQSGAIWKRCFLKTLFSSVDRENDAIWKRWRHQNRHDRTPDHSTGPLDRCCSVDGRKRYENDKCGRKSFWKRSKTATFLFENGLVWTAYKNNRIEIKECICVPL